MFVVALALGTSACYGVSNFLGPQLARRHALASVLVLSQLAALVVCVAYLAADPGRALPTADLWLALFAGACNAFGLIGFYKAAELGPLSVVAPIGAVGAALAARRTVGEDDAALAYPDPRGSVIWACASAVAFGAFLTALPKATAHGRAWGLLDARVALLLVLVLWAWRELSTIKFERSSAMLAVPGLLLVAGTVMYTTATDHGQLSLVSVLGSLFPVVTVTLGVALLRERLSRGQAIGVAATLVGIALIAL